MKKIVIICLVAAICLSSCLTLYFYSRHKEIDVKIKDVLRYEITKEKPDFGYLFTSSIEGIITSYPLHEQKDKNIGILFSDEEQEVIKQALSTIKTQKELYIRKIYNKRNQALQLYLTLQNDTTVRGLIFLPEELKKFGVTEERHILIFLSLSIMTLICCMLLLIGLYFITQPSLWWYVIILLSVIMFFEIWFLWSLRNTVGFQEEVEAVPIISKEQENSYIQKLESRTNRKYTKVPTGIFIERLQFSQSGCSDIYPGIFLNGYIWQRYNLKEHAKLDRNIILPDAYTFTMQELYHKTNNEEETICWAFSCNLYQNYNTKLYPFDHRHIIINLLHKNFENDVILIPDLEAYDSLDPFQLPGLTAKMIILPYWNITKSFFNFSLYNFKTSLGFANLNYDHHIPYLQFFVTTYRKLGGNFIMYFISILIVLVILFVLLMAFLKQETLMQIVGFSTLGVLGSCSGLLFVLVTSEVNLRQTLMIEGIVYLEYLYFVCYFAIIGVIIDSILFAVKGNVPIITYHDNLIFKLLFWPITLLAIVIITAYALY